MFCPVTSNVHVESTRGRRLPLVLHGLQSGDSLKLETTLAAADTVGGSNEHHLDSRKPKQR